MCIMCGIFALLNTTNERSQQIAINEQFNKGRNRGPEYSRIEHFHLQMAIGFHRLSINGLNSKSNQPIIYHNIVIICNGEIYNYKSLYDSMDVSPSTDSDCEVIIHLYIKYGIEQTLLMLDGVYSFVLYDYRENNNMEKANIVYVARDPLGVRPLYKLCHSNLFYGFASELKCLEHFYNENADYSVEQFTPGTYSKFIYTDLRWTPEFENKLYYIPSFSYNLSEDSSTEYQSQMFHSISQYLNSAVIKRCTTTERPVACLLSGGLDSSLIAALVSNYFLQKGVIIETYSIGLEGSEDIKYAKIVADYIGSKHTEIIVSEKEMFDAIPEVIHAIESYDTTTVRASIGNYLLGKYISSSSGAKVIFNGDGSDELFGGYLYMNKCPDDIEFDKETRRLLKDIYLFDVLRSDKCISSHGLEPRTPFLDKSFVNYVLSISPHLRNHRNFQKPEKYLLRNSFTVHYFKDYLNRQLLPDEILFRQKEAFSDGVSSQGRSLFTILQEYIADANDVPSIQLEKQYYKEIFDRVYPNCSHILPYFWMPKYTNATDPSARTLAIYQSK